MSKMNRLKTYLILITIGTLWSCNSDMDIAPVDVNPKDGNKTGTDTLYYLAMGDSYTIGASVEIQDCFPMQLAARLNLAHQDSVFLANPDIVAKSGWTSSNLLEAVAQEPYFNRPYDLVTLLIGVNNQYQQLPFSVFEQDMEDLLQIAIESAGGDTSRVVIVSVPDYAYTPFGQNLDEPAQITSEIEKYNGYLQAQATEYGIPFVNITPFSREGLQNPELLAEDGLHPAGKMYTGWVNLMLRDVEKALSLQ